MTGPKRKMTEKEKAEIFDLLQRTRVIEVRENPKRIVHGNTKSIEVPDFVISREAEKSLKTV